MKRNSLFKFPFGRVQHTQTLNSPRRGVIAARLHSPLLTVPGHAFYAHVRAGWFQLWFHHTYHDKSWPLTTGEGVFKSFRQVKDWCLQVNFSPKKKQHIPLQKVSAGCCAEAWRRHFSANPSLFCSWLNQNFRELRDWLTFNTHKKGSSLQENLVNMPLYIKYSINPYL